MPPVLILHKRLDGRISLQAVSSGLSHIRAVCGIQKVEGMIEIVRIAAQSGQIDRQSLQQIPMGRGHGFEGSTA